MHYNWLMTLYNWQQQDWPNFRYDLSTIMPCLLAIAEKSGLIHGKISHLSQNLKIEAMINLMVEEGMKTSAIEGEYISRPDLRSSIKNTLGINNVIQPVHDMRARGVVEMMFDVRNNFQQPLTENTLYEWHLMLLGGHANAAMRVGCWRSHAEPMQIVSNHNGKWVVHYEAPPSINIPQEMHKFIEWFNTSESQITISPVRAAIAHLYFESIHPFEDGNGRIGRAIAEKALSQGAGSPIMLSLSQAIEENKKTYYAELNAASRTNEITAWIQYFVNMIAQAQQDMELQVNFILKKSEFFTMHEKALTERQLKVIRKMFEAGSQGFEGGMSAKKYMGITDTSKATATRDLQYLFEKGVLRQLGAGRSVRYELNI